MPSFFMRHYIEKAAAPDQNLRKKEAAPKLPLTEKVKKKRGSPTAAAD